jgi:hypothetical protein
MWEYMKPYIVQQLMQKKANQYDDANDADDQNADRPTAPINE